MINRSAVIVHHKQPYIDWATSLDDSGMAPSPDDERTVYLVPVVESDLEIEAMLVVGYDAIFERELEDWHLIEADWPTNRTFAMFQEWFDVEVHSMVTDLCDVPLVDDEF